jgi:hypothetical protein
MEVILFIPSGDPVYQTRDMHKFGCLTGGAAPYGITQMEVVSILEIDTPPEPPPASSGLKISLFYQDSEIHSALRAA